MLLVNGFLGKSSEEDHAKIYWDVSLNSFVDVKDSDIVQTESLSKEASPLGGSYVWVKRDAKVYFGAGGTVHQGQVLGRPYENAYGGQYTGASAPAMATPGLTNVGCVPTQFCPPTLFCATRTIVCIESRLCVESIPCGSLHCIETVVCNTVGSQRLQLQNNAAFATRLRNCR